MNLNIFIEEDVLKNDLMKEKGLITALTEMSKISDIIVITVITKKGIKAGKYFDENFKYLEVIGDFNNLLNMFDDNINKDQVYISENIENIAIWDRKKGKSIFCICKNNSKGMNYDFNKICLKESDLITLEKLRKYIHI